VRFPPLFFYHTLPFYSHLASYSPGCLYYLSCWYTRKELGFRTAVLYSGALISGAFSGLISAGVTWGMDGTRGLGAWQWLFIIEGAATVAIAIACYFVLPNFPRTTDWLGEEERALAVWYVAAGSELALSSGG
jgi:sugar phosphate permease